MKTKSLLNQLNRVTRQSEVLNEGLYSAINRSIYKYSNYGEKAIGTKMTMIDRQNMDKIRTTVISPLYKTSTYSKIDNISEKNIEIITYMDYLMNEIETHLNKYPDTEFDGDYVREKCIATVYRNIVGEKAYDKPTMTLNEFIGAYTYGVFGQSDSRVYVKDMRINQNFQKCFSMVNKVEKLIDKEIPSLVKQYKSMSEYFETLLLKSSDRKGLFLDYCNTVNTAIYDIREMLIEARKSHLVIINEYRRIYTEVITNGGAA